MGALSSCLSHKRVPRTVADPSSDPRPASTLAPMRTITQRQNELLAEAKEDFRQGNDFFKANNTNEAKSKYAEALHKLKLYEEEGDNVTEGAHTTVLSNIGALHFAEGRFIGAKALLAEAEKERAIAHGDRSLNNPCLLSLAIAIRHDIADRRVPSFQRNLESDVKEHSSIDSLTADLMNNLAACYEVGQDLEQARRFYAESLKLRKVVFGERSLKVAEAMQNLATILDALGHTREAEDFLMKALAIEEEIRGRDSVESTVTMNNLGVLAAHLADLPRARDLLSRCYGTRLQAYGAQHELTLCVGRNLDRVERALAEGRDRVEFGQQQQNGQNGVQENGQTNGVLEEEETGKSPE